MGCVQAFCNVWSPQYLFTATVKIFIRVVCVLYVANKSSWRICEKHDIKWSVSSRLLPHPLSAPPCSAVERHGTLTIFSSTLTKNYPIPSHCLTQHVLY